jgi:hypothetical protein
LSAEKLTRHSNDKSNAQANTNQIIKNLTSALRDVASDGGEVEIVAEFHEEGEHCGRVALL